MRGDKRRGSSLKDADTAKLVARFEGLFGASRLAS